ncbi:MAG TPA: hypothetical protein VGI31_06580, partial [Streptosporangiaceae bacterium]
LTGMNPVFEPVLAELNERHRDEVLAAFAAVEHSPEPVPEVQLLALRDATLRRSLDELLGRVGRTLVPVGSGWTSGYRDEVAAELTAAGWYSLPVTDRAVLVLVLIHSVAVPRSRGVAEGDAWTSGQPTMASELLEASRVRPSDVKAALARLRAAGLVQLVQQRGAGAGQSAAYLPGPQLHRLTAAARRRLQEELILAAAPSSPLAAAIRARRANPRGAG